MNTKKLETFNLLAKRYWKTTVLDETPFIYSQEEAINFEKDIIKYLKKVKKIVATDLELNRDFTVDDLLLNLKSTEENHNQGRLDRISAANTEIVDDEYRLLARFVTHMNPNLQDSLSNLKIYLIIKIWNSFCNGYNPETDLLINHYLNDDGEFREQLVKICYRGINNPGFCQWILNNWNYCWPYHKKIRAEMPPLSVCQPEQLELLEKIIALE